jgi:hypothetical protein
MFHNFSRRVGRIEHQAAYDTFGSRYQSEQMARKLNGLVNARQRWVSGFGGAIVRATAFTESRGYFSGYSGFLPQGMLTGWVWD